MQLRPLYDRIVVKRLDQPRTAAGIVIPDNAQEKPAQGEVIAVGQGRRLDDGKIAPLSIRPGDSVLFASYAGQSVKVHGEEFLVIKEDDVLGVYEDAKAARIKKAA